jgi:hypothetical protein
MTAANCSDQKRRNMLNRCDHGNYIPKGDTLAPNCSGCGTAILGIFARQRSRVDVILPEKLYDVAEYIERPLSDRFDDAVAMESTTL